jgi:hypothetical protein
MTGSAVVGSRLTRTDRLAIYMQYKLLMLLQPIFAIRPCFHNAAMGVPPGDEGRVRPSSAAPSSLRAHGGPHQGPAVPPSVLQLAEKYQGAEGRARPGSAAPSTLRATAPQPVERPSQAEGLQLTGKLLVWRIQGGRLHLSVC